METSIIPDIKHLPFFCDLPEGASSYLKSRLREFSFAPNQLIIEKGKHGNFLGIVGFGLVDLEKPDGQIQTLLPGEMFGEQMLLFRQPSSCTVRARSESSLWVITRSDWVRALQINSPRTVNKEQRNKKKIPVLFFLLLVLLLSSLWFLSPELPQWANQQIVRTLLTVNRPDLAEKYLQFGVQYNPTSAELREAIGSLYFQQGDLAGAQQYMSEAVKLDEWSATGWNNLGVITLITGKPEDALSALSNAVELDPGSPEAYCNMGGAYAGMGELDRAEESFRRAAELKPDYEAAKIQLAAILMQQKNFPDALMVWEEILYWSPEQPVARFGRGVIAVLENRPEDSIADLEAALLSDPVDPYAHFYLGTALRMLGQLEQARIEFETVKVVSRDPVLLEQVNYHLNALIENSNQ